MLGALPLVVELVDQEPLMIARAAETAIAGRSLLSAIGRAKMRDLRTRSPAFSLRTDKF
jgi:hypothetical protein